MANKPGKNDPKQPFQGQKPASDGFQDLFDTHRPFGRSETGFMTGRSFRPSANIYESPDGLTITLEIPGMTKDEVDISLDGRLLTVKGIRNFKREHQNEEYVRIERGFGSFNRTFEVPSGADGDNITAELDSGILEIKIPVDRGAREIVVEPGEGGL